MFYAHANFQGCLEQKKNWELNQPPCPPRAPDTLGMIGLKYQLMVTRLIERDVTKVLI